MVAAADEELAVLVKERASGKGLFPDRCRRENFQAFCLTFDGDFREGSRPWIVCADRALQSLSRLGEIESAMLAEEFRCVSDFVWILWSAGFGLIR